MIFSENIIDDYHIEHSHYFPYPFGNEKPLAIKDLDPETLTAIVGHIGKLKNFRTVQEQLQKIITNPFIQMADLSRRTMMAKTFDDMQEAIELGMMLAYE